MRGSRASQSFSGSLSGSNRESESESESESQEIKKVDVGALEVDDGLLAEYTRRDKDI